MINMATLRVKSARRLASLLTKDTGVDVAVCYLRRQDQYQVRWADGPGEESMRTLALGHVDEVQHLTVTELTWARTKES